MDPHSPTGFGDADRSSSRISARDPSASREAISKKVIVEWGAGGGKASDDVVRQRCRGMWKSPKISTVIVHGPGDPPTGGDPDKGKDEEKEMDFLISIFEMRFNYQDFWIFGIWEFSLQLMKFSDEASDSTNGDFPLVDARVEIDRNKSL